MIECLRQVCKKRHDLCREDEQEVASALASAQGDRDGTPLSKLSARSRGKFLGLKVPPVVGIQHKHSVPYVARQKARE